MNRENAEGQEPREMSSADLGAAGEADSGEIGLGNSIEDRARKIAADDDDYQGEGDPRPECSICRRRHGLEVQHPCE